MNAPSKVQSRSQALRDCCRHKRWELLQQFGEVEIALAARIPTQTPTFGAKLRVATKSLPQLGKFKAINDARNLLAHAHVSFIDDTYEVVSVWRTADICNERNGLVLNRPDFERWAKRIGDDLDTILKLLLT